MQSIEKDSGGGKKAKETESKKKVVATYASLRFCGGRTH